MSLFDKDYKKLSAEELKVIENLDEPKRGIFLFRDHEKNMERMLLMRDNPFVLNYKSLFPANYLNEMDLSINRIEYIGKIQRFQILIDSPDISERDILNFIRVEQAYFIIGSILQNTIYGHHDRYIFAEMQLPPNYQADFLLIGKNSHGYNFLFVELENPKGDITLRDGSFGNSLRKGLNQIEDWKSWNESNISALKSTLQKYNILEKTLPKEFFEYDSTRYEYAVIAGRRSDFNDKSNRRRRELDKYGIYVFHYDNLFDLSEKLLRDGHY